MHNNCLMSDHDAIALTADVLEASPPRLFELAYQEWHGQAAQAREAERAFVEYLLDGKVPCWVRAFTRNTLTLCEEAGMALPVTQTGHNLTLRVTPTELLLAMLGLGAVCLLWLTRLL
jgi:hypothetical protein